MFFKNYFNHVCTWLQTIFYLETSFLPLREIAIVWHFLTPTVLVLGLILLDLSIIILFPGTREEKTKKVDEEEWYQTLWKKIKYIFTCCREPPPQPPGGGQRSANAPRTGDVSISHLGTSSSCNPLVQLVMLAMVSCKMIRGGPFDI